MMEFEPPLVGCVISSRNYTFDILKKTRECVIIPTRDLVKEAVGCGNTSGRTIDKLKAFHLTPTAATVVKAPLIDECYANLECRVVDASMVNKYNFFILEVLKAWIDPSKKDLRTIHHRGKGMFMIDGKTIKLPSKDEVISLLRSTAVLRKAGHEVPEKTSSCSCAGAGNRVDDHRRRGERPARH
jgi:flavin reductase (DIM6/NTAB) family NADH-FMN oxidoreductase RutF